MFRRSVDVSIKLGIVRFILLENVVNGSEQHSCNGNDSFFVAPALFYIVIAVENLRVFFLCLNCCKRTLNKQRLDIGSSPADSGGFLLPGTFVVLRRKTSP